MRGLSIPLVILVGGGCGSFGAADPSKDGGADASVEGAARQLGTSCKNLLEIDPARRGSNGYYEIDPDGSGANAPIRVYCDMTLANGGWTLVGRSTVSAAKQPFGWRHAVGSVDDFERPYSLDVAKAKLVFDAILIGELAAMSPTVTSSPVAHAYRFAVPPTFLEAQNDSTIETGLIIPVLGDCKPTNNGPSMLRNAGHTELDDFFWFRDVKGNDQHRGLGVDGLNLSYDDCDRGGLLDGKQGVLFVR